MAYLWEVEHRFEQGLPVANIVDSYPSLNVTLDYTDSKLVVINHKLETDGSEACNIIDLSKKELQVFLAYLQFDYGPSLPPIKSKIKKNPENLHERLVSCNSVSLDCGICRATIRLPDNNFFSEIDYRKYILLLLANKAQEMKEPEYAIRNYYIILEELYPEKADYGKNRDRVEVKYIRDFVSHSIINNETILGFLSDKLQEEIYGFLKYDPLNLKHKELVNTYKIVGARLIDEEFNKIINDPKN